MPWAEFRRIAGGRNAARNARRMEEHGYIERTANGGVVIGDEDVRAWTLADQRIDMGVLLSDGRTGRTVAEAIGVKTDSVYTWGRSRASLRSVVAASILLDIPITTLCPPRDDIA